MTAQQFMRRMARITIMNTMVAGFVGLPVLIAGISPPLRQGFEAMLVILPPLLIIIITGDLFSLHRVARPIRDGLRAIEAGERDSAAINEAVDRTLHLPFYTFLRIIWVHAPVATVAGLTLTFLFNDLFELGFATWQVLTVATLTLTLSLVHAIIEYFMVLREAPGVLALLQRHTHYDPPVNPDEFPDGIRERLVFVTLSLTSMPFLLLGAVLLVRFGALLVDLMATENVLITLRPLIIWVAVLVSITTAVLLVVVRLLTQDIYQRIESLLSAMADVRAGGFGARLAVTTTDEFAALYRGFNQMAQGLAERERLQDAFGRYVSPELAERVIADDIRFEAHTVEATVLFCDIRGFTRLSEEMTAGAIVDLLNDYFARVEPVIKAQDGWINKFLGDGFMAVFGVPVAQPDHKERAIRAALAIREATEAFNAESDHPDIGIGIGVACGDLAAGVIGSPDRVEYTVIGDVVNLASRIEMLNKALETTILLSDGVYEAATGIVTGRSIPDVSVRGKAEPITVYAVD